MKIINIGFTDKGGAGLAISRTHNRLRELGYESILFLADDFLDDDEKERRNAKNKKLSWPGRIVSAVKARATALAKKLHLERKPLVAHDKAVYYTFVSTSESSQISIQKVLDIVEDGDIVILYWLGLGLMNSRNIGELIRKADIRLYWYALDMAPVTGGCHYFWDCRGYLADCSDCPALEGKNKGFAHTQHEIKKQNLQDLPITLLASSDKGVSIFREASIRFQRYYKMPYAINTDAFNVAPSAKKPIDKPFRIFLAHKMCMISGRAGNT
jgi:hypothetical protein